MPAKTVVLREIELKRVGVVDCDVEPDGCESLESTAVSIEIEPGTYDEAEFDIHKVSSGDPEDAAFRSAHPELIDTSVRVEGKYDGTAFVFVTNLMDEQRYDLTPALDVTEGTTGNNVTLHRDIRSWFSDAVGVLIDPATANKGERNENLVKNNIRNSIDAFEDANRDGQQCPKPAELIRRRGGCRTTGNRLASIVRREEVQNRRTSRTASRVRVTSVGRLRRFTAI